MGVHSFIKRESASNGFAIVVGSGMLMATMDMLDNCSRFVEYKDLHHINDIQRAIYYAMFADFVVVNGWFSISKPDRLIDILRSIPKEKIYYYSNIPLIGNKCVSLSELKLKTDEVAINNQKEIL